MMLMKFLLFISLCCFASTLSTPSPRKVAVIGATGRLGQEVVQQLIDRGYQCNLLVRNKRPVLATTAATSSTSATHLSSKGLTKDQIVDYLASLKGVQIIEGDVVGNVTSLQSLLDGCSACLAVFGATRRSQISDLWTKDVADSDPTHAKAVNYQGVANLLEAAKASTTCKRIVRITGKGESPYSFFSILINMLGSMAKAWNYEGERLLRDQQDIDYTIIRPGVMSEEGPGDDSNVLLTLADDGADLPVSKIRYRDIATLCIDCLDYPNTARSTLTAMTTITAVATNDTTTIGSQDYAPLLTTVQPDRRAFPSDMLAQHRAAVRRALFGIGIFLLLTVVGTLWRIVASVLLISH